MKVLIVEPDQCFAAALSHVVEALGHHALTHSDPLAAIQAADESSPDLILLGLSLRGFDIYQYTETLRRQDHLQHVKIVAVSGEVSNPAQAREAQIDTELLRSQSRGLLTVVRESLRQVEQQRSGS